METAAKNMVEKLPYDSEIEWLMSDTVGQPDQIEIQVGDGCSLECKMQIFNTGDCKYLGLPYIDGKSGGVMQGCCCIVTLNNRYRNQLVYMGEGDLPNIDISKPLVYRSPTPENPKWLIDGVEYLMNNVKWNTKETFYVFHRGTNTFDKGASKLWYLKIYENEILKRDLIPVRKGDEGFLFDKISGEMFGNVGPGKFVLGPDV